MASRCRVSGLKKEGKGDFRRERWCFGKIERDGMRGFSKQKNRHRDLPMFLFESAHDQIVDKERQEVLVSDESESFNVQKSDLDFMASCASHAENDHLSQHSNDGSRGLRPKSLTR